MDGRICQDGTCDQPNDGWPRNFSRSGRQTFVVSSEDLILLKLLSGRVKDLEDIRGICRVQGTALDSQYLAQRIDHLGCRETWNAIP